jgi:RNA polymerase sigma-70 factor (ECF subfamily)
LNDELRLISKIQKKDDRAAADTLIRRYYDEIYRIDRVMQYVNALPAEPQQIFRMKFYGDYTFAEIAELLSMPESSVKSKYYRLLNTLRKEFGNDYD